MNCYERALVLKEETLAHRRWFHTNAEVGLDMPLARRYVTEKLGELGVSARRCGHGITATVGSGGRCILLRADMDALPMAEESALDFACPTGRAAHTCGHDLHAAMLLTAAKLLKEREGELAGTVKLMFQPGEETLEGAADMLERGLLDDPRPEAALAVHVAAGHGPVGSCLYNSTGTMMSSVDGFRIHIKGRGSHGAYPHSGVDPIHIAAHIFLALEGLAAREADPARTCILTVGSFTAGSAANIIPDEALLQGTVRMDSEDQRRLLLRRIGEVARGVAGTWGGSAGVEWIGQCPALVCDPALTEELVGYLGELGLPGSEPSPGISAGASEDFARIAQRIPATYLYLSAGFPDRRGDEPAHSPRVLFNEEVCPVGAAVLAHCAARWLEGGR